MMSDSKIAKKDSLKRVAPKTKDEKVTDKIIHTRRSLGPANENYLSKLRTRQSNSAFKPLQADKSRICLKNLVKLNQTGKRSSIPKSTGKENDSCLFMTQVKIVPSLRSSRQSFQHRRTSFIYDKIVKKSKQRTSEGKKKSSSSSPQLKRGNRKGKVSVCSDDSSIQEINQKSNQPDCIDVVENVSDLRPHEKTCQSHVSPKQVATAVNVTIDLPETVTKEEQNSVAIIDDKPQTFKAVTNIAYSVIRFRGEKKIAFKCFLPNCPDILMGQEMFEKHIKETHTDKSWEGFCITCQELVACSEFTMFHEWKHLIECHVKLENVSGTQPQRFVVAPHDHNYTKQITDKAINLRPWLKITMLSWSPHKPARVATLMLNHNALAATFKCMDAFCAFFTSDAEIFRAHVKLHEKAKPIHAHDCPYCLYRPANADILINHINSHHEFDIYQCCYCFYRSASSTNVQSHIEAYHPDDLAKAIECAPRFRRSKKFAMKIASNPVNLEITAPPMLCSSCDETFNLIENMREHLATHEDVETMLICRKCNMSHETTSFTSHLLNCYKIGLYQCAHCLFGCNTLEPLKLHFANYHPTQYPIYCIRSQGDQVRVKIRPEARDFQTFLLPSGQSSSSRCSGLPESQISGQRDHHFSSKHPQAQRRQRWKHECHQMLVNVIQNFTLMSAFSSQNFC